jgi:divalent metal cation (Fe/Co/Zn/Cd) transporter
MIRCIVSDPGSRCLQLSCSIPAIHSAALGKCDASSRVRTFVEFHLEVEGHLSIEEGHAICDMGEAAIKQLFQATVEITAHLEPAGIDDDRLDHRIASAQNT